jgi:molybdopterin-biosynthesis enzyme MoeA-like protein
MKATIVTIGDEILIGQIVDTNSAFIAKSLDRIGVEINEMISMTTKAISLTLLKTSKYRGFGYCHWRFGSN